MMSLSLEKSRIVEKRFSDGSVVSAGELEDTSVIRLVEKMERKPSHQHAPILSSQLRFALPTSTPLLKLSIVAVVLVGTSVALSIATLLWPSQRQRDSLDVCNPMGIHLAPRTDVVDGAVSMTVSFFLLHSLCRNARPVVHYGRRGQEKPGGSVAEEVEPLFNRYTSRNTDGKTFPSDLVFHVELPNLQGGEQNYWYRIEVEETVEQELAREEDPGPRSMFRRFQKKSSTFLGASPTYYFKTPPLPGSPTSVAIVADWGDTVISLQTAVAMIEVYEDEKNPISQVIVAGDIAYADGEPWLWSKWFQDLQALFQHVPLTVSVGNHETECDINTLEVFSNYEMWFQMPNRIQEAETYPITPEYKASLPKGHCISPIDFLLRYKYGNSFYAYTHGLLKVIVLNPYTSCARDSVQYRWLEKELEKVDRSVTPWVLAVVHTPFYSTFAGHPRIRYLNGMEYLFNKHHVNVVVGGHDHGYMRSKPLAEHAVLDKSGRAPVYFIVGTGGSSEGPVPGYRHWDEVEPWVAARNYRVTGFGQLTVQNATHAEWEFHANQGLAEQSEEYYTRHIEFDDNTSWGEDASYRDHVWLRNMHV